MITVLLSWLLWPLLWRSAPVGHQPQRLLVIQTAKIGDLICTTPVFRALRREWPEVSITAMIAPGLGGLLAHNPAVDRVVELAVGEYRGVSGKLRLAKALRDGGYDAVLCLTPSLLFVLAMYWARIPWRLSVVPDYLGLTFRLAKGLATHLEPHLPGRQSAATFLALLRHLGVTDALQKEVFSPPGAADKVTALLGVGGVWIGLGVSSGNKMKELGATKLAAVASGLLARSAASLVLVGAASEQATGLAILEGMTLGRERVVNGVGRFSLAELPALVARFTLYVGVDSGVTYMADALGIPLVDVSGPADMRDQRPLGTKVVIVQSSLPCVPCSHSFHSPYQCQRGDRACIELVTAEQIVEAALPLLVAEGAKSG